MSFIVYGIGGMGRGTASLLLHNNCDIKCFVDKGVRESKTISINGNCFPVFNPEEAPKEYQEYEVLISMAAAPIYEVKEYLNNIGFKKICPAGDVFGRIISSHNLTNVWKMTEEQFQKLSNVKWNDDVSQLHWRIACEWFYDRSEASINENNFKPDREKYLIPIITDRLKNGAIMIDTAFLNGEYSEKFVRMTNGRSYAFKLHPETICGYVHHENIIIDDRELFSRNADLLCKRIGLMEPFDSLTEQIVHTVSIDNFCAQNKIGPDFLRIYSMSETMDIILGACDTIITKKPMIAVNIGHYMTDFIAVPLFLKSYCENYEFYFRLHSFQGNDCILYALPLNT